MKKIAVAASLALILAVPQADAAIFDFSYDFSDGVNNHTVSGQMVGTLLDANTVNVSAIQNIFFDTLTQPSMLFTSSDDVYFGVSTTALPIVTFDGSFMDLYACDDSFGAGICNNYMIFAYGNAIAGLPSGPSFTYKAGFDLGNNTYEVPFNASNWTMTENTSFVPVPATLPLLGAGVAAFAWQRRRQAA